MKYLLLVLIFCSCVSQSVWQATPGDGPHITDSPAVNNLDPVPDVHPTPNKGTVARI